MRKKKDSKKYITRKKNNIKLIQEKISQWLIKNKYIYDELYKSLKEENIPNSPDNTTNENTNSDNKEDLVDILMDLDDDNEKKNKKKEEKLNENKENMNIDNLYEKQINNLNNKKSGLDSQLMLYNKELEELSGEAKEIEDQKKQEQIKKNIYNNNYILFKIKSDLVKLEQFIKEHEGKLKDGSKLATIKVTLTKKVEELSNTINKNIGKVEELKNK